MLEAAPDRAWPAWREMRSVIRGGLRARSAQNQRLPARANVRLAVMLALATFLALMVATYFWQVFCPDVLRDAARLGKRAAADLDPRRGDSRSRDPGLVRPPGDSRAGHAGDWCCVASARTRCHTHSGPHVPGRDLGAGPGADAE